MGLAALGAACGSDGGGGDGGAAGGGSVEDWCAILPLAQEGDAIFASITTATPEALETGIDRIGEIVPQLVAAAPPEIAADVEYLAQYTADLRSAFEASDYSLFDTDVSFIDEARNDQVQVNLDEYSVRECGETFGDDDRDSSGGRGRRFRGVRRRRRVRSVGRHDPRAVRRLVHPTRLHGSRGGVPRRQRRRQRSGCPQRRRRSDPRAAGGLRHPAVAARGARRLTVASRFDAVLFDAGGVLVLPDPTVLGPLLEYYGGDPTIERHRRAHYAGMKAKSDNGSAESDWADYDRAYVESVGVGADDVAEAADVLGQTRHAVLWRWPIAESRTALDRLAAEQVPMGVVSNASGQIEGMLAREMCQVGPGPHVEVRCVVDSHVVGVAKPDPAVFDVALAHFAEFERSRIAYVGDSVTMDVATSAAAGLHPILIDPYDDHAGASFERIGSVADLAAELSG